MTGSDLDLDTLAAYLHLTPSQVERLVTRGKIPGRKVGGVWRFSEAEIHHWMEQRIGLADEDELITVEGALRRNAASVGADSPHIHDWLSVQTIRVPLAAKTRGAVIDAMVAIAAETGLLWDAEKMAEAVRAREELHSTALDIGVALLHPRRPQTSILAEPILALGITSSRIPFGDEGQRTDVFFLICSTDDRSHLQILARISRLISQPDLLDGLRQATNAQQAYQLLCDAEAQV
jgi:PTS system nitrogen regulatory IIA component